MAAIQVRIQHEDFDPGALQQDLLGGDDVGAVVAFTGIVRRDAGDANFDGLYLEHYPGMSEKVMEEVLQNAAARWQLVAAGLVHRVGELRPGDNIVWVGVASSHRADAFAACEFAMDQLKTSVPLWKKERRGGESVWVDSKTSDTVRAQRWQRKDPVA